LTPLLELFLALQRAITGLRIGQFHVVILAFAAAAYSRFSDMVIELTLLLFVMVLKLFEGPALGDMLGAVPIECRYVEHDDELLLALFRQLETRFPMQSVCPSKDFHYASGLKPSLRQELEPV
jgi:hypothetical protein